MSIFKKVFGTSKRTEDYKHAPISKEVSDVLSMLKSPDLTTRMTALAQASRLAVNNKAGVIKAYVVALKDPEPMVRNTVLYLLPEVATPSSTVPASLIFSKVLRESPDRHDLFKALEHLAQSSSDKAEMEAAQRALDAVKS